MADRYKFTQDWFSHNIPVWQQVMPMVPERRVCLEIGAFEGRSTVWLAENGIKVIDCVDTWTGGEEHSQLDMLSVEEVFDHNMAQLSATADTVIRKHKGMSTKVLGTLIDCAATFDLVYIDGSHIAKDVLTDACMAWTMLRPKGILIFDDYLWGEPRDILHRPKAAIDAFANLFAEELDVIHSGYQFIVKRKG
jgi:predicted O-methyltransferase YrrM